MVGAVVRVCLVSLMKRRSGCYQAAEECPDADMATAELLKLGQETVVQWLPQLAASMWQTESVPDDWVKHLTIPLHKKGVHNHCNDFRGIALLSVPGKVFCRVIQKRLTEKSLKEN